MMVFLFAPVSHGRGYRRRVRLIRGIFKGVAGDRLFH